MAEFIFTRVTFDNDINLPQEYMLPRRVYQFIETDPNVPGIGNKYAFVINYISGLGTILTDAQIKIYFINRVTQKLDYLTTVLLSATFGKTVNEVAGVFVTEQGVVIPDVPGTGGDFNNDFNNDFLISAA